MGDLMARWQLPGGQVALAKDGRLVLNRGYGLADVERAEPVQPTSLFRIASVTKAITAVAILTLVDAGTLALDDAVFPLLAFAPPAHATMDPRLASITVQNLLVHAGGWDSAQSFDPQGLPFSRMAAAWSAWPTRRRRRPSSASCSGNRSTSTPALARRTPTSASTCWGASSSRSPDSRTRPTCGTMSSPRPGSRPCASAAPGSPTARPGEVRYYAPPGQAPGWSVFWGEGFAPFAYGGSTYLEALDAHGGWIATAADLVRFATAVDGQRGPALLAPETVQAMITTPRPPTGAPSTGIPGVTGEVTAGLGWDVIPEAGGVAWSRVGALMGSTAAWVASPAGRRGHRLHRQLAPPGLQRVPQRGHRRAGRGGRRGPRLAGRRSLPGGGAGHA